MTENRRILVRQFESRGPWLSPETSTYHNEAHLQAVLVEDPSRLPGVSQQAAAVDELWTSGGPIDVCVANDQILADWYFDRVDGISERKGDSESVWWGARPGGGVFLHPYGLRYAPIQMWINGAGRLTLFGNWKNWAHISGHPGFAGLAEVLGQNHQGPSRGVLADNVDQNRLWTEVLACAEAVN